MGIQNSLVRAVLCGLLVSGLAGAVLPAGAQQPANPEKNVQVAANSAEPGRTSAAEQAKVDALPDSPGTNLSTSKHKALASQGLCSRRISYHSLRQPSLRYPGLRQARISLTQILPTSEPVGTAAAEAPHTTGVAASQPAGVAIAPAKQPGFAPL